MGSTSSNHHKASSNHHTMGSIAPILSVPSLSAVVGVANHLLPMAGVAICAAATCRHMLPAAAVACRAEMLETSLIVLYGLEIQRWVWSFGYDRGN